MPSQSVCGRRPGALLYIDLFPIAGIPARPIRLQDFATSRKSLTLFQLSCDCRILPRHVNHSHFFSCRAKYDYVCVVFLLTHIQRFSCFTHVFSQCIVWWAKSEHRLCDTSWTPLSALQFACHMVFYFRYMPLSALAVCQRDSMVTLDTFTL